MNQRIEIQRPAFDLIGISARTTNAAEAGPDGLIPKLWETYFQSPILSQIKSNNSKLLYALYTDYESDASGAYTLLLGHEKGDGAMLPVGLSEAHVPAAKYMLFTTQSGPFHEVVPAAWKEIWTFFQTSEITRTYTGDFELYRTAQFDPNHAVVEIYIAVH